MARRRPAPTYNRLPSMERGPSSAHCRAHCRTCAVRREQAVHRREGVVVVRDAHRLEHLGAHDFVEPPVSSRSSARNTSVRGTRLNRSADQVVTRPGFAARGGSGEVVIVRSLWTRKPYRAQGCARAMTTLLVWPRRRPSCSNRCTRCGRLSSKAAARPEMPPRPQQYFSSASGVSVSGICPAFVHQIH